MDHQTNKPGRGKRYSQEFRDQAVRLSVTSGKSVAQIARELGLSVDTLHDWRRDARYDHRMPVADNETAEQKIARLEQELALVEQERDILKKAMAYFAQPPRR